MKTLYISEMMNDLSPDELGLDLERTNVSAERIWSILQARGVVSSVSGPRRHGRRPIVWIAVAAALILGLSVTAYAVYQAFVKDYIVETPTLLDAVMEDIGMDHSSIASLSLVGCQGTPEYEAYAAWEAWQAAHYGDHPMDNSNWHETPDNYYDFYDAAWQDQADALDQITAKYGVRLHENRAITDAEKIYELLGAEPFISDEYENCRGYIYNDGTFSLDFDKNHGDVSDGGSIFVSVKGTITDISGGIDMDGGYEEWNYQTASGPVVDLVLSTRNCHIFYETESAYIHVNAIRMGQPHMRQFLEALADSIDFEELSRVFGEGACFELTQAVEELDAAYEQQALALERQVEEAYSRSLEVEEKLGVYGPNPVPEGYAVGSFSWGDMEQTTAACGTSSDGVMNHWGGTVSEDRVFKSYVNAAGENFHLSYSRYYTDESRTASATAEQFAAAKAYYAAFEGFQECQVNGCPGFYFPAVSENGINSDPGVLWLDASHDLMFELDMSIIYFNPQTMKDVFPAESFTPEELIALAATVTAE